MGEYHQDKVIRVQSKAVEHLLTHLRDTSTQHPQYVYYANRLMR